MSPTGQRDPSGSSIKKGPCVLRETRKGVSDDSARAAQGKNSVTLAKKAGGNRVTLLYEE